MSFLHVLVQGCSTLILEIYPSVGSGVPENSVLSLYFIQDDADVEWKFARAKLWLSYFEEPGTLPVPFNLIPSPKSILALVLGLRDLLLMPFNRHRYSLRDYTEKTEVRK